MNHFVHVSQHPLVQHKLTKLRDVATPPPAFRQLVRELSQLLFLEATVDLPIGDQVVRTPLTECTGKRIAVQLGLMPILRAGLGMAEAIQDLVPDAQVWHLGLYRDEKSMQPVTYYNKLPMKSRIEICYIVDPMLATGGSASAVADILKQHGMTQIKMLALIAEPEGVEAMAKAHPDVPVFLAALDERLNEKKYIVPGLGDAGDRQFGTVL